MTVISTSNGDGTFNVHGIGEGQRGHLVTAKQQSDTRREAEFLTNIVDQPQTWGTPIPNTAGRVRVQGAQVWVSPFIRVANVYDVTTNKTETVPAYFFRYTSDETVSREGWTVNYPTVNETVVADAETQYSIAYSFGYNLTPQYARKLSKVWINGLLVYDLASNTGVDKYKFEFHPNGGQSETIAGFIGKDNAPFYPNQTYLVIKGLRLEDWGNQPIQSCSAEFTIIGDATGTYHRYDTGGFPSGSGVNYQHTLYDYEEGIAYSYLSPYNIYPYGRVVQWSIDNYTVLNIVDCQLATQVFPRGNNVPVPGNGAIMFKKSKVMAYSGGTAQNTSAFYAMNLRTGIILASQDSEDTWPFSNCSGGEIISETDAAGNGVLFPGYYANGFYAVNVNDGGRLLSVKFVGTPGVDISADNMCASDGKGFCAIVQARSDGKQLYQLTMGGITKLRTLAFAPESMAAYAGSLYLSTPTTIRRESYGGQLVYQTNNGRTDNLVRLNNFFKVSDVSSGSFGWLEAGTAHVMNLASGEVQHFTGQFVDTRAWDSQRGLFVGAPKNAGNNAPGYVETFTPSVSIGGAIKLRDFIRGLYQFAGQDTTRLIFNDIDDDVPGGFVLGNQPLADIITNLIGLFRINRIDGPGTITFYRNRPLTGTVDPDATLDIDQLIYVDDSDDDRKKIQWERKSVAALADTVELKFIDPDSDYMTNTLSWTRPNAALTSTTKLTLAVPLVLTKQQALSVVQNNFNDNQASGVTGKIRLPPMLSMYESGDVLAVANGPFIPAGNGRVKRQFLDIVQIVQDTHNADDTVDCDIVGVVTTTSETFQLPVTPGADDTTLGNLRASTKVLVIDSASATIVDDTLNDLGYVQYSTVFPKVAPDKWPGGYAARSRVGSGEGWRKLYEIAPGKSDVVVFKTASVMSALRWQTDYQPLTLTPVYGTWDAADNVAVADLRADASKNLAFVGRPGAWELVQFASIVNNVCTGMIRGRRGTEVFCGSHFIGDYFVIVGRYLFAEQRGIANIGNEEYKGVALTQTFNSVDSDGVTVPQGNSAKPWAVASLKGARQGNGDISLSWVRRDRIYRNWGRKDDAKLSSETVEKYSIDILAADGTVKRTINDIAQPSYTYTAADQTTDFGSSTAATVTLMVYQVGAHIGRGFAEKVTINV